MKPIFLLLALLSLLACNMSEYEVRKILSPWAKEKTPIETLAERAQKVEEDKSIEQLKQEIEKQSKILNSALLASQNLGQTYYLLGLKYLDYQMYGQAFEFFEKALEFYPEKIELLYNMGVCAGWMAESHPEGRRRQDYLKQSRFYLEKSLRINKDYGPALLSLAILYSNSFDMPNDAKKLIQRYNEVDRPTTTSLFVEARIAVQTLDDIRAIEIYSELAETAPTPEEREIAQKNRENLTGM